MEINSMNIDQIAAEQTKLTADLLEIEKRIKGLQQQVSESEATVNSLNGKYEEACLDIASGKDADPSAPAAARDRESHKLRGLKQLLQQANEECQPIAQSHQALSARVVQLREKEKEDALLAAQATAYQAFQSASQAMEPARLKWAAAAKELDDHRHSICASRSPPGPGPRALALTIYPQGRNKISFH